MASDVEICNRALQRLGNGRITDLSEDSNAARECNTAYAPVRDALLRKYAWNFAKTRAQLAASSTAPAFGPANAYPLPSDCLRLLPDNDVTDWQIESGSILTDDDAPLQIRYTRKVTDPNEMDVLFREVLSCDIALAICERLTQSNTKEAKILEARKELLSEAKRANAFENISEEAPEDPWVTARY